MLVAFFRCFYNWNMKKIIWSIILSFFICYSTFAIEDPAPELLRFSAINAGYKTDESSQNYDFIELYRPSDDAPHSLADYRIVYTNSSGNQAGEITFSEYLYLAEDYLTLGFKGSPQYQDAPDYYLYNFSTSGLASTAGKLELFYGDELIDEVCWGKITCAQQFPKFATSESLNESIMLLSEESGYYAEPNWDSIIEILPESSPLPSCDGITITEIYSYYQEDSSEQFIELFNPTSEPISLDNCRLVYKKKSFPLSGVVAAGQYLAFQDDELLLTKNPTKAIEIIIRDANDTAITTAIYDKKQKRGTSYAQFDDAWRQTYAPTPGAANQYQQFQTCDEGKTINPQTGNCVKATTNTVAECKDGYYRNPATGRCKKVPITTVTACRDGYERNPETNRCRKIVAETGQSYAVAPVEPELRQDNQSFIAVAAIVITVIASIFYVLFQFRHEFAKLLKRFKYRLQRHLPKKTV